MERIRGGIPESGPGEQALPPRGTLGSGTGPDRRNSPKIPATAGILAAVLPGAGHLYSERYRDAAIAFVLNAAFIWGMVEAFEHENYVVGGILTFFELGWYSGNIYSAVSGAHKYNRNKKKEYLDLLEKEDRFAVGIIFQDKQPFLSFRYVF